MNTKERYNSAKDIYRSIGIDTDNVLQRLKNIPISMNCWQGDDITGFENMENMTSGGIQATGNYMGKPRTVEELMDDMDKALSLIPGRHRINLHASYGLFGDELVDRDKIEAKHFERWVEFAKERGLGLDFNATFFSHPKSEHATLSSEDEEIRSFWIEHGKACLKIAEYFASELNDVCTLNYWIPDGFKDVPSDRTSPRARLKDSLDQILSADYDADKVEVTVESKVFGIGLESYTVGSHEFYMNYAAKNDILYLLDNGHFHPTEKVSDKISSMLLFFDKLALHVTRPVRWDSDHVVLLDDETKEIAKEIIRNGEDRVTLGLDFFDASINRISAWVVGMRNMQKALLSALLLPHEYLAKLQEERNFTKLMALQEEYKLYPVGDVWDYFCETNGVPIREEWFKEIEKYEDNVLARRN